MNPNDRCSTRGCKNLTHPGKDLCSGCRDKLLAKRQAENRRPYYLNSEVPRPQTSSGGAVETESRILHRSHKNTRGR